MLMAGSLRDVQTELWQRYGEQEIPEARLIALLFAPPATKIAHDDLIPRWNDFHHRSGQDIDFFCAGYGAYLPDAHVLTATRSRNGHMTKWQYSSERFDAFVRQLERTVGPRWRYSGEVDLLLFNAHLRNHVQSQADVDLDLSTLLVLNVDAMLKDKVIPTAAGLFEAIIHYAPNQDPNNPTLGFSYAMSKGLSLQWLKEAILKYVPGAAGIALVRGKHYVPHFA